MWLEGWELCALAQGLQDRAMVASMLPCLALGCPWQLTALTAIPALPFTSPADCTHCACPTHCTSLTHCLAIASLHLLHLLSPGTGAPLLAPVLGLPRFHPLLLWSVVWLGK